MDQIESPDSENRGISRRDLLRKGATLGGAVVWVTPAVQTLGMGRAFAAGTSGFASTSDSSDDEIAELKRLLEEKEAQLAEVDSAPAVSGATEEDGYSESLEQSVGEGDFEPAEPEVAVEEESEEEESEEEESEEEESEEEESEEEESDASS